MELDITLGSSVMFFSPRQLHSFHAIFQALVLPAFDIKYTLYHNLSNKLANSVFLFFYGFSNKSKRNGKRMQLSDYRRIENELQQQIKQATLSSAPGESLSRKGWSSGCLGSNRNLLP